MAEEVTEEVTEEEVLPDKIKVKNISQSTISLTYGAISPDDEGFVTKSEFENFVGTYLEKV